MIWIIFAMQLILTIVVAGFSLWVVHKKTVKESEFYTDYVHGTLIMRIYKVEFEYQAIGSIDRASLLDGGQLNLYYRWALIQG